VAKLTNRAKKDLDSLPPSLAEKARAIIRRLDAEPSLGKKLLGQLEGMRSARLGRSHRILYRTTDEGQIVLTISPRKDAYR
jgi:mRNA-degrading endonuclease RelE of RelBE toxin-antitoxin system